MRVLLADGDVSFVNNFMFVLREGGYTVDCVKTEDEILEYARLYDYDLIVLDLILKQGDGIGALHRLRTSGYKTPVIVASVLGEMETKVEALNMGADDFLQKPFHMREFMARAQAVTRRSQGHAASSIDVGRLQIDLRRGIALVDRKPLDLTNKEYAVLELMATRKGMLITKQLFLNHLYNGPDEPEPKVLDVFICRLRKKISLFAGGDNFIHTVWGRGYVLRDPMEEQIESVNISAQAS